ncbi:CONSERVED ONLY IN THE GREEN LINEAGE 160, chloroplastic-like protein [Drosera capensis]
MATPIRYFTVTASSTPITPDAIPIPPQSGSLRRPTKIILPKGKPQKWSTGTTAGELGGPPTGTTTAKWGPWNEDPVTAEGFIWNKEFKGRFERLLRREEIDAGLATDVEDSAGFLNFDRVMNLNSVEVDLSAILVGPPRAETVQQPVNTQPVERATRQWKPAPTRREIDRWNRATRAASGGTAVVLSEASQPQEDPQVLAARAIAQYNKLKLKLQLLTLGIGGTGLVSAYLSYTPEVALSFGAGLIGSLVYLRMLGNSVDSLGGGAGIIRGAVGQPRLLVPVILVMVFNRWNEILVPKYGLMHLELIPMLVGFFTYKIATFIQAIDDAISVAEDKPEN